MGVEDSPPILSDAANSKFSVSDRAMMITEKAGDLLVFQLFVEKGFFECHMVLPHLVQKGTGSQCIRVKDNIIIPQSDDYFA